jgi:hypothetical protein
VQLIQGQAGIVVDTVRSAVDSVVPDLSDIARTSSDIGNSFTQGINGLISSVQSPTSQTIGSSFGPNAACPAPEVQPVASKSKLVEESTAAEERKEATSLPMTISTLIGNNLLLGVVIIAGAIVGIILGIKKLAGKKTHKIRNGY